MSKQNYAWYSPNQARVAGTVIYLDPDGKEVEASCVSYSATDSGSKWPDIRLLGPVTKFVRRGRASDIDWDSSYQPCPKARPKTEEKKDAKSEGDQMMDFFFRKS